MNILGFLAGALGIQSLTDYPKSITTLKNRLPKEEQDAFIHDYKKLSASDKTQFKEYLKQADLQDAGKMIGHDLSKVQSAYTKTVPTDTKASKDTASAAPATASPLAQLDFSARIQQILQTATPSVDPLLLAEAAKKYQALQLDGLPFAERHKRIMEAYAKGQAALDAPVQLTFAPNSAAEPEMKTAPRESTAETISEPPAVEGETKTDLTT
ncbi:hypothetical protein [Azotosporobacter soli]|uniref:hypothetical protein n=1 Tax=Azotosporobacter soli TaxID=3055040 RepID=UPI0031FEF218